MSLSNDFQTGSEKWYIGITYLQARDFVLKYANNETLYLNDVSFDSIDESYFLQEAAWVVLNSGMKESIINKLFTRISTAFYCWESAQKIVNKKDECFHNALSVFGHRGKIQSIIAISQHIVDNGFPAIKSAVKNEGVRALRYPYLGSITSIHLEKNLGLDVVKPDRHLVRIAQRLGYQCVNQMCSDISSIVGDSKPFIDTVLWKFATLNSDYLDYFRKD